MCHQQSDDKLFLYTERKKRLRARENVWVDLNEY